MKLCKVTSQKRQPFPFADDILKSSNERLTRLGRWSCGREVQYPRQLQTVQHSLVFLSELTECMLRKGEMRCVVCLRSAHRHCCRSGDVERKWLAPKVHSPAIVAGTQAMHPWHCFSLAQPMQLNARTSQSAIRSDKIETSGIDNVHIDFNALIVRYNGSNKSYKRVLRTTLRHHESENLLSV
jgi:hypothetical protein